MNKTQQKLFTLQQKFTAQERLKQVLTPWMKKIMKQYRPGDVSVSKELIEDLRVLLRNFYSLTMTQVTRVDFYIYKQDESPWYIRLFQRIAKGLSVHIGQHQTIIEKSIEQTVTKYIQVVSKGVQIEKWENPKTILMNYLMNHRLTIAVTESQWAVETARSWVVKQVRDPLKNTLNTLITLIEQQDYSAVRKISKEANQLARLPLSVSQGEIITYITDDRVRLITPRTQSEVILSLQKRATQLEKNEKVWQALGDSKTRSSHSRADGQQKQIDEPFVLPGGLLQYPGDASLGASLSEIIGCRCATVYV